MLFDCQGHLLDAVLVPIAKTVCLDVQSDKSFCVVVAITNDMSVALQKSACRTALVICKEHSMQARVACSDRSSEVDLHASPCCVL